MIPNVTSPASQPVGHLLRAWRQRRRLSQLDLACDAEISTRHLSFVETGRSQPSRDMLLQRAERLEVPLRERNALLAAGYAPIFPERRLDDPALGAARKAMDIVLAGHEPYPALAIDRHWNLVAHNRAVPPLLEGVDASLLAPPLNVLRLSLHPTGIAPRIANLLQWREHLLARLARDIELSADPVLVALREELLAYPHDDSTPGEVPGRHARTAGVQEASEPAMPAVVVPFQLCTPQGVLSFVSTTTVFGTPLDVTLSELALESFFPADEATAAYLRGASWVARRFLPGPLIMPNPAGGAPTS